MTVCGGCNKELDDMIHAYAIQQATRDMETHPCGCLFCYANALIQNLRSIRIHHKLNPDNGEPVPERKRA